ncbi:hypothetical protein EHS25_008075 [Saitozyma podzolica]|uniref:NADH:ubiquinone oxidoreductase intermediate-associated protein 30 domain-containing protein n=1 Tax=Saitozyma podzolica TaxID=1890683 RepID=A0A427YNK2_9TREE|nr:hypothetical protein EHS25_008075 [Saitozyma podzolica]
MSSASSSSRSAIFPSWHFASWTAVDDRVRGGSSRSHLDPVEVEVKGKSTKAARFWGTLDIKTLGGAGFSSQRYIFGPRPLSLPRNEFKGIYLSVLLDKQSLIIAPSDSPSHAGTAQPTHFTVVLKTTIRPEPNPPKVPPSPEPASLSYEATFSSPAFLSSSPTKICLPWDDFRVTYRGREVPRSDPRYEPLDPSGVYEMSLMCRSGFGKQEGEFGLVVLAIGGWRRDDKLRAREGCWDGLWSWA